MTEGEKGRGGVGVGGHFKARKISSARFIEFGLESVGTTDASFDISLTFDLDIGFATPLSSACK